MFCADNRNQSRQKDTFLRHRRLPYCFPQHNHTHQHLQRAYIHRFEVPNFQIHISDYSCRPLLYM